MIKKGLTFVGVAGATLALTAGTASAHDCYNAKRSDRGNQQVAAHSNGQNTYAELLADFGLCESGITYVEDNGPDSIPLDVPVNSHATMAGGTYNNGQDAKGVDHIDATEAEWIQFEDVINEAFADCEAG